MLASTRELCERAFRNGVSACDPTRAVREAIDDHRDRFAGRRVFGLAIGKAALPMARGAGPVVQGVAVTNADDGRPPPKGWTKLIASHPEPDERSLEAGDAVIDLVASAGKDDVILALISGGASALVERPLIPFDQFRAEIHAVMASGAPIRELNRARIARSAIKGGKLARMAEAPVVTFAVSDVMDDDIAVIGSGPTITDDALAEVIVPMSMFSGAVAIYMSISDVREMSGPVPDVADRLAALRGRVVAWGEPTLAVPDDHGEGGRAQQLALELAKRFRGGHRIAFVAGSDGMDGPRPAHRAAPAGAYVDGHTWDAIAARGIDPERALARCDAGPALDAVGALVITGPTGVNHADVAILL